MREIIQFREVESKDFKTIHKWLNEKHVREFFQPYWRLIDENHPVVKKLNIRSSRTKIFKKS